VSFKWGRFYYGRTEEKAGNGADERRKSPLSKVFFSGDDLREGVKGARTPPKDALPLSSLPSDEMGKEKATSSQRHLTSMQVKTWYDESDLRLVVTVLSAADLPKRVSGQYRNPYAKVALQPNKR